MYIDYILSPLPVPLRFLSLPYPLNFMVSKNTNKKDNMKQKSKQTNKQ